MSSELSMEFEYIKVKYLIWSKKIIQDVVCGAKLQKVILNLVSNVQENNSSDGAYSELQNLDSPQKMVRWSMQCIITVSYTINSEW